MHIALATVLSILPFALLSAEDSTLPALESFFTEPTRLSAQLSPDGKRIAYLSPDDQQINRLWVIGVEPDAVPLRISPATGPATKAFFWIGNDGLLWQMIDSTGRQHLSATNSLGNTPREILAHESRFLQLQGVVATPAPCVLVGLSDAPTEFPDLYRVNLLNDSPPERVAANTQQIITWAWDADGTPVAGLRWTHNASKEILNLRTPTPTVVFRSDPTDDARLLSASKDGSQVMILTDRSSDFTHVEALNLTTGTSSLIATDPLARVDIEQIFLDPQNDQFLAASYADSCTRWQTADPKFDQMLETMGQLSETRDLTYLGSDANRTHHLLKLDSTRDPGTIYLYDSVTRQARMLWKERPEWDHLPLCETKACDYPSRDGCRIPAYLTTPRIGKPPWPLVVFPHGGPRMRTRPGFDGRVQFLASRGYAVLQPNFRGSRGYGKRFMNAGDCQWGRGVMQTDVSDGVESLIRSGIADPQRVAILGGSYGGYAALAGLAFTPDLYAAGICIFGMSDLLAYADRAPIDSQAYAADTIRRLGDSSTPQGRAFLSDLSPVNHAAAFKAPLLIYHGAKDPLIPPSHAEQMALALQKAKKPVNFLQAPDEAHGFARPESEMAVFRAIEMFLHQHLGGKLGPTPTEPVMRRLSEFQQPKNLSPKNIRLRAVPKQSSVLSRIKQTEI